MRDQKHLGIFRSLLRADPFTSQRSTSASLTLMFTRRISISQDAAIRD